jgi:hypothetical protein
MFATMRLAAAGALTCFAVVSLQAQVAAPPTVASLAQLAIDAAGRLRTNVTLSAWRRDHPSDEIVVPTRREDDGSVDPRAGDVDQLWCGLARDRDIGQGSGAVRRRAFFYVPARIGNAALPALGSRTVNDCVRGAIDFTGSRAAVTGAVETFSSDSGTLATRIGPIAGRGMIGWFFDWSPGHEGTWHHGDVTFGLSGSTVDSAGRFSLALAISGPGFPGDLDFDRRQRQLFPPPPAEPHHAAELDTILAWSGLDAGTRASLVAFADRFARDSGSPHLAATESGPLAALLGAVVRPEPSMNVEHRTARLLAADLILAAGIGDIGFGEEVDSATRAPFTSIGETFGYDPIDKGYWLTHGWLQQAVALNSPGPAGDHAFLLALRRAFDFTAGCGSGSDLFREVIKRGEQYLATRARSPIRGEVQLLVGEGYGDLIALASGAAYDGLGIDEYRADSIGARATSVRHFREGYRLAGRSSRAAADWPNAWRLAAGLDPVGTHFYCIDD